MSDIERCSNCPHPAHLGKPCRDHRLLPCGCGSDSRYHDGTRQTLFQLGEFKLHSGAKSPFKIECDSLTSDDWAWFAYAIAHRFSFGHVVGVPTGGLELERHLALYRRHGSQVYLIVDDVLTTGRSMEEARAQLLASDPSAMVQGAVAFSRAVVKPDWIWPVFQMGAW